MILTVWKPMSETKEKQQLIKKLRNKYRLTIYNDRSFEEVLSFRLSRLNVFTVTGIFSILLIGLVILLIAFTQLREFIPGYPDGKMRKTILMNSLMVDSLQMELDKRDRFFQSVRNVIAGNDFDNAQQENNDSVTDPRYKNLEFSRSVEDSVFRREFEEDEKYNLAVEEDPKITNISSIYFFSPVKGVITSRFNAREQHYGTDVVAPKNERISAVLSGTVFFSEWTLNTGYVIHIQHGNNLVSVYKHNSELLKKAGEHVKIGEAIALLGNSGELSSGPHLHFELWHNGKPLNPEDYIKF
jgi:murein DD-endopeptidase MepM/ murein hydrolase activator NlpD